MELLISIILKMFWSSIFSAKMLDSTYFRRIARPLLGMSCRNEEPLDSRSGDIRFDALVVTEVYLSSLLV